MDHGYSRCSANETKQDINRQVRELKSAGADTLFLEYEHGDSKIKSQQEAMFAQAQAGDTSSHWRFPGWHEAPSNFAKSLTVCGKSVCGW